MTWLCCNLRWPEWVWNVQRRTGQCHCAVWTLRRQPPRDPFNLQKVILKHNQRDATSYNVLYCCQCCTCFERFFRSSSGARKLYMQHRLLVKPVCCYRWRRWVGTNQFWWWAEKPLETCRALTTIRYIVHATSCWFCLRIIIFYILVYWNMTIYFRKMLQ